MTGVRVLWSGPHLLDVLVVWIARLYSQGLRCDLPYAVLDNEESINLHQSIHREPLVPLVVDDNLKGHLLQDFYPGMGIRMRLLSDDRYWATNDNIEQP